MNIKYSLMSAALLLMAGGTVLTGCNAEGDDFDYGRTRQTLWSRPCRC